MDKFNEHLQKTGEYGIVEQIQHPIVTANGLPGARMSEVVIFETGEIGEIFLLHENKVQIFVFSNTPIKTGSKVVRTDNLFSVPCGEELLGQVIDPLGNSMSANKDYKMPKESFDINIMPPGISKRVNINKPFHTGVSIVDMMVPLGEGQKELVIGDRKTGKTSFLLAAMKAQALAGKVVIYCPIAKRKSDIRKVQDFFERENIRSNTIIVGTDSHDSPSLIFISPYSAMTIAEYFRDRGRDVLVVFDDLSSHARFYREISLLANKFPGRDSYPGDIFHVHAKLLERAGNFTTESGEAVSITALPVVEIVESDFTGYISTNLMSITDGHLYFDSNIYYKGRRPAVNIALSVTRVGRQTQSSLLKSINQEITAFLTLFEKMQNLSHFGAELTDSVKKILQTGESVYLFFDQGYELTIPVPVQVILFSLFWLKFIDPEYLRIYRANLISAYEKKENEAFFNEALKQETFNKLLAYIAANKEKVLSLGQSQ